MYKLATNDPESTAPEVHLSLDELAREGARRMIAGMVNPPRIGMSGALCHITAAGFTLVSV